LEPVTTEPLKLMEHPIDGQQYMLIGGPNDKCLSNGNTWQQSKVLSEEEKLKIEAEKQAFRDIGVGPKAIKAMFG
jgi:hypothetical protein